MITYAIDSPPPATIILVTSENAYSYAVSILRLRKYRVVVIAPPGTMIAQASVQLDWNSEVLRTPPEGPHQPDDSRSASRRRADSIPYSTSTSRTQYMTDADDVAEDDMYEAYDKYRHSSTSHSTPVNGTGDPSASQRYAMPPSGRQTPAHPPVQASSLPLATSQSAKSKPSPSSPHVTYKTPEPVFVTEGNGLFESSTRTPNLSKGFPYSDPQSLHQSNVSAVQLSSSSSSSSSGVFHPPFIPPAAPPKMPEPVQAPTPPEIASAPKSAPNSYIPAIKPVTPVIPQVPLSKPVLSAPVLPSTSLSASKGVPQAGDPKATQTSSNTNSQPIYFVTLAQKLRARHEALGHPRIPRTDIGSELAKHKSAYAQAGVTSFAAFINLAHAAGVVDVGGLGNDQWVSLRPDWPSA